MLRNGLFWTSTDLSHPLHFLLYLSLFYSCCGGFQERRCQKAEFRRKPFSKWPKCHMFLLRHFHLLCFFYNVSYFKNYISMIENSLGECDDCNIFLNLCWFKNIFNQHKYEHLKMQHHESILKTLHTWCHLLLITSSRYKACNNSLWYLHVCLKSTIP